MRSLPVYNTGLVGRVSEIAAVADALAKSTVVALVGAAGIGKTRLACEVAARQSLLVLFVDASGSLSYAISALLPSPTRARRHAAPSGLDVTWSRASGWRLASPARIADWTAAKGEL